MKRSTYIIIISLIILILLTVLIVARKNHFRVVKLDNDKIMTAIDKNGGAILYTKKINKDIKSKFKSYYKEYKILTYTASLNLTDINELLADYNLTANSDDVFIIFMNGTPVDVVSSSDDNRIVELIEKNLYNIIPISERYYQVLNSADQYIKKVNSNNYTVAVFAKQDCTYCDLYLPIINDIAREKHVDIYYFNRDEYDEDEYNKIMALDFEIPAKCNFTNYSTTMSKSFPKPMTIITKGGEFVDCIRGYVTEEEVLDLFKKYKIVKE